ncbi:MAG: hypothetical protein NTU62_14395 [Spirochaetes bacterium]|jgi:hypothetical protein|nr:hypothetical protein [Spirochaetota bacterium]
MRITRSIASRRRQAVALGLLVIGCIVPPAFAQEAAGYEPAWTPQMPINAGFDLFAGYFLPKTPDFGFDLFGPSLGFAFLFQPFILQTPVIQLAARTEFNLFVVVLFGGGGEGQGEFAASLKASFGPWEKLSPFLSGGITLTQYAITSPSGVSASEFGWGYRIVGGISLRKGRREIGHGSTNEFVTPEITWGHMYLETIECSYLHVQLTWTGLSGIGRGPHERGRPAADP